MCVVNAAVKANLANFKYQRVFGHCVNWDQYPLNVLKWLIPRAHCPSWYPVLFIQRDVLLSVLTCLLCCIQNVSCVYFYFCLLFDALLLSETYFLHLVCLSVYIRFLVFVLCCWTYCLFSWSCCYKCKFIGRDPPGIIKFMLNVQGEAVITHM